MVWQTGTYDAVRGTDPEEFRASVSDGVEKLQAGGADVVLVNMQYSPRTESIVAVGAYADGMRWVSREREVPVFDRLAIMRHWYDAGQFDLYKATKDLKMAKSVHDCLGRVAAALVADHGFDALDAVLMAERAFRGGDGEHPGLGRERVYLEGLVRVRAHLERAPDDERVLACGQVGIDAAASLRPLAPAPATVGY